MTAPTPQTADTPRGLTLAITVYGLWGFLPLYMKALAHVPTLEVLAHRILWSLPLSLLILSWFGYMADLKRALKDPAMLKMAALTAALISVNWGVYVWSIQSGHALEAALGYYINPLFSVFLGFALLKERLSRLQWAAIALAATAVLILAIAGGTVPYVALALMLTWGFYAYFKRKLPIGPNQGFALEVLMLFPFALAYAVWLEATGTATFLHRDWTTTLLLAGTGVVTAVPLMIYANAAKELRLSTIGILQYIAPTLIFLTAVFLFDEPMGQARMVAFPLIWSALALYSFALLRRR